ncbi:MAG: hypothetical protein QOI20_1872 [Acidimicrobiaceae bacterium]|jgi:hypothetical protein|nr:hypothetical protein [Acidimicrobiaceae bacterium]
MTDATEHELAEWPFDPEAFWRSRTTDEVFANAKPWTGEESFVIEDLTDEESEAFWAAVNE